MCILNTVNCFADVLQYRGSASYTVCGKQKWDSAQNRKKCGCGTDGKKHRHLQIFLIYLDESVILGDDISGERLYFIPQTIYENGFI